MRVKYRSGEKILWFEVQSKILSISNREYYDILKDVF
jgi:hypothetical protein